MSSVTLVPEYARRVALTRERAAFDWISLRDHLPDQHDQDDHAGVDADEILPNFDILASKRAGGHMLAVFVDNYGDYGTRTEGARYVALRMHDGGSKTWDEEALDGSLIVEPSKVDALGESMNKAADETKAYQDPHGKVTDEDDDNRPPGYEQGPLLVSRQLTGSYTIHGYHDRYGDRTAEGGRFIVISDVAAGDPSPTWDENLTLVDARKVKFVVEGMKSIRDDTPTDRARLLDFDPTQKRDEQGRWTDGFMSESALEAVADLVDIVDAIEASNIEPKMRLRGESGETLLFELPDGRKIVRKRIPEWGDPDNPKRMNDAEQLGGMVAAALDVTAPRSYRTSDDVIWIEHMAGDPVGSGNYSWGSSVDELPGDPRVVTRMGLLDVLIVNNDRHGGNMFVHNGQTAAIDHGEAWISLDADGKPYRSRYPIEFGDSNKPVSRFIHHDLPTRPGAPNWIENPLTDSDIETTRGRLESLRGDFKRLGRETWLDYSLSVLNEIAIYAEGTESVYG